jgi:hypothetical protein
LIRVLRSRRGDTVPGAGRGAISVTDDHEHLLDDDGHARMTLVEAVAQPVGDGPLNCWWRSFGAEDDGERSQTAQHEAVAV